MSSPVLRLTEQQHPAGGGWREIGQVGWQHAWFVQLVRSGRWGQLKGSELSVLGVLLAHANVHGHAWPNTATLSAMSGQAERTVQVAINQLVAMGIIERRPADEYVGMPYYAVLRSSSWAADEDVMASDRDVPARFKAHANAPAAHPTAPQAQPRAPKAQPAAPPSIQGTSKEHTSSSSSTVVTPKPAEQAGLFDDDVVISMLEDRAFVCRRAAALVAEFGSHRCREAMTHCDFLQAKGEIRKSYQAALTGFLQRDLAPDARIAREAQAAQRREQERLATLQALPASAQGSPLTGDARSVEYHANRLRTRRPNATWADCLAFARDELAWPDDRWKKATADLSFSYRAQVQCS